MWLPTEQCYKSAMQEHPERLYIYQGFLTDCTRWDHFPHRPGDVFVCTMGKNGTTWMQAICSLLIFQTPELDFNPAVRSPWFDATFDPVEEIVGLLEGQMERRVIKTHTPLDGIPYFPDCTYLTVYRDPRDAFFSMRNHMDNMKLEIPGMPDLEIPEEELAFRNWVAGHAEPGEQSPTLAFALHHLKSFHRYAHLPNIHVFHYADLKRNLGAEMGKVSEALAVEIEPKLLAELVQAASFANMRDKAELFAPGADKDTWHDTHRFFNKGESGQWRDQISEEALALFDARVVELIGADLASWLEHGSSAAATPDSLG